ncbi:MAG: CrcB family protein [Idiomarina sp.]|nr:CrcB family protein [Idiomarina sp.]
MLRSRPFLLLSVAVLCGGAVGAIIRGLFVFSLPQSFPFATLTVNILGCLLMGLVVAKQLNRPMRDIQFAFLSTGLLGALTTLSALTDDTILVWQELTPKVAMLFLGSQLIIGFSVLAFGLLIGQRFIWPARNNSNLD